MNADCRVTKYLPSTLSASESDAFVDRLTEHHKLHGYTFWAVEVCEPIRGSQRGTSPFVGFVGLQQPRYSMPFEHEQPLVDVGWRLAPDSVVLVVRHRKTSRSEVACAAESLRSVNAKLLGTIHNFVPLKARG